MSRRRAPGRAGATVAVALACALAVGLADPLPVGPDAARSSAADGGGASSRVVRGGRIVTWILHPARRSSGRGTAGAPAEAWIALGADEVMFLVHLVAARPDLVDDDPLVAALAAAVPTLTPDAELQLLVRRGVPTTTVRTVPAADGGTASWARRMVTVLPVLRPAVSPPDGAPVPVGTPVFVSFPAAEWNRVVDESLSAGGVTARVRARPVGMRLSSGDPADVGRTVRCDGPGRPYDPADPAPPAVQARRPGACTLTYRTPTGVRGRRRSWFGEVTVLWRAEWTTDGTSWRSLGVVPRLGVVRREVDELGTAIEVP
jgi:hypothetical protein